MHVAILARASYRIIAVTVPVVIVVIVIVATARTANRCELRAATAADPHHAFTLTPTATRNAGCTVIEPSHQLYATAKAGVALLITIASALANDDVVIVVVTGEISIVATGVDKNTEAGATAPVYPDCTCFIAPALTFDAGRL